MSVEYGDQLIVHFLDRPEEKRFYGDEWPLHVTLLPWFVVSPGRQDELHDELSIIARRTECILATTEDEARFGKRRNIPVRLVGLEALKATHYKLVNAVQRLKGELRDPEIVGRDYRPHVTQQGSTMLPMGQELKIDSFSLVEKVDTPYGDREIIRHYELEG